MDENNNKEIMLYTLGGSGDSYVLYSVPVKRATEVGSEFDSPNLYQTTQRSDYFGGIGNGYYVDDVDYSFDPQKLIDRQSKRCRDNMNNWITAMNTTARKLKSLENLTWKKQ